VCASVASDPDTARARTPCWLAARARCWVRRREKKKPARPSKMACGDGGFLFVFEGIQMLITGEGIP
jgi:hypothetical protein